MKNIEITSLDRKKYKSYYEYTKHKLEDYYNYPIALIDNRVTDLRREIIENTEIKLLGLDSKWGNRTYTKTLSLIFVMALKNLFPELTADLNHYIGSGLYIDFKNISLSLEDIEKIKSEMDLIIENDYPINISTLSKAEAITFFRDKNADVLELLETVTEEINVGVVECNGFYDINYSILAPSTGFITSYKLMQYYPGMLLISPNKKNEYNVDNYQEMPKLAKIFQNSTDQFKMLGLNKVASINKKILEGKGEKIIKISEAIFDRNLIDIAEKIEKDKDIKMVLISGPTSSGKTTFTNKLKVQLEAFGYEPVMISMDDYFVNREDTPLDEKGEFDFESPFAVDLDLFNKDMYRLLNREHIKKRVFDFISGVGKYTEEIIEPSENTIIMIEGIHGLNPIVSKMIPEKNKYKIYISALNQVNLDSHNRVSTTNGRLIRRSIRDDNFRGYSIEETFKMWENIIKAEEEYIFPFQEEADVLINSSLPYETAILKKHIVPMLNTIKEDSIYYNEAINILEILKYFVSIEDDTLVSSESLLREFIGK